MKLHGRPSAGIEGAARLLALAALLALPSACKYFDDPFSGYYDTAQNLISASGLDAVDLTTAGYEANAAWTWAWRGQSGDHYEYLTLADTATAVGAAEAAANEGLDEGSAIYRLTLANLAMDGDFNAAASVPTTWYQKQAAPVISLETSATMVHGSGKSLHFKTGDYQGVRYSLVNGLRDYDQDASHSYYWYMYTKNANDWYYQIVTGDTVLTSSTTQIANSATRISSSSGLLDNRQSLSSIGEWAGGTDTPQDILFGYSNFFELVVDDLRFVRSDITPCLRLRLRKPDTSPTLIDGYYEFTLWIRKPADLTYVTEDGAADPYAASQITLAMNSLIPGGAGGASQVFAVTGEWQEIKLRQNRNGNFNRINAADDATPAVELAIYPCDHFYPQPGTVEIAQPELHIYVNDY